MYLCCLSNCLMAGKVYAKDSYNQYRSILSDLKAKRYRPFYLLMGEEPYYIDKISHYLSEHVLTPDEQGFNQTLLYGSDVSVQQIIEAARRYPMMAPKQVVIVREAQQIKDIGKLELYLQQAPESTVLVICHPGKTVDKRTVFYREALTKGVVLESVALQEEDVADWIIRYASEVKVDISPEAAVLLAEYLGTDLSKIIMEMDKLLILLPTDKRKITPQVVEKNVGISKEHSPFALCKALSFRDLPKALRIARYFGENSKNYPLVMILGVLFAHFSRLMKYHALSRESSGSVPKNMAGALGIHPFFLKEVEVAASHFSLKQVAGITWMIRAYDSRSKSNDRGEADDGALLQELIFKILK